MLVEKIQNVAMQRSGELQTLLGLITVDIQFVFHCKVVQRLLQHVGRRFAEQARGTVRRFDQHGLHLPPGGLIPDADDGMEDQPPLAGELAEIDHDAVQNRGIRNRDLLVLDGTQMGDLQPHLRHIPDHLVDLDAVADLESTAIDRRVSGNQIGDGGGRSERENDAQQDRHALEGLRLRTGHVRIGHDDRERDDDQAEDPEGRHRPVRIESGVADRAAPDLGEIQLENF